MPIRTAENSVAAEVDWTKEQPNMIMLVILVRVIKVIPKQAAAQALKETVRGGELDSNLRALEIGLEAVEATAAKVKNGRAHTML